MGVYMLLQDYHWGISNKLFEAGRMSGHRIPPRNERHVPYCTQTGTQPQAMILMLPLST
jgi:hypothetical protein